MIKTINIIKTISILLISTLLFTACITKELPAYKTYTLNLSDEQNIENKKINKSIQIDEARSLKSINSSSILYSKKNFEQEAYLLSKWSDRPSKMLQKLVSMKLHKSNSFKLITSSLIKAPSDYKLKSEILSLIHNFKNNKSYSVVSIKNILIDNKSKEIKMETFSYEILCEENNSYSFVKNANKAVNLYADDLDKWLRKSIL